MFEGDPLMIQDTEDDNEGSQQKNLSLFFGAMQESCVGPERCLFCGSRSNHGWPFSIFGCFGYQSPDTSSCVWCPGLIPKSCCTAPCVVGAVHTADVGERPLLHWYLYKICLGFGREGFGVCMLACLLNACSPLPISPAFCCYVLHQRKQIARKYGMSNDGWCSAEVLKGCCVPCALLQVQSATRAAILPLVASAVALILRESVVAICL
ncbi:hypothetical protein CYMTET_28821 [Cymbomonas tetramitiformis]|uniref:PLAC8 family protein n=1 Tax=Cymbomonas tetramitiformis TaxID=36881 RepID=A0AAE0FMD4_9CHLO|nr:hypothetical protein CYMTET_28821 [Cymbomonas tetramitiformis]